MRRFAPAGGEAELLLMGAWRGGGGGPFPPRRRRGLTASECEMLFDLLSTRGICLLQRPSGAQKQPEEAALAGSADGGLVLLLLLPRDAGSVSQLPYGKALYTYEGKEPGDLKFNKGDIIILRRKVDENWYHGELNGNHGFFPASYIQCIKPLPQAPPQGKALYDFEIKDKDQDKDCLTFTKDEILTVIRRVDDNWAEGMLGDKIGIFPILYVELNESAKQLIEMDKTCSAVASGCDVPLPTETAAVAAAAAAGLAPCSTLASAGAAGAAQRQAEGKKNAKKRHSFTALSMTHKSSQAASNRHSMEISAPVLISSSDPRAAARIGDLTHLSSSAPAQDSSSIGTATVAGPRTSAIIGDQGTPPKVQLPLNIYLALYAYKPQKNDELELRKGEMYRVIEKCQDGWFKGTSLRSGMSGVFPGNYVTPVSRVPVGAGQPRNSGAGGAPATKGAPGAIHPIGASHTNVATAVRPVVPITAPQTHPQLQAASPQLNNCLRYSAQQPASQTRNAMQMAHPPVPAPDRPTATVSPLRTPSSPSRLPAAAIRPHPAISPPQGHQPTPGLSQGSHSPSTVARAGHAAVYWLGGGPPPLGPPAPPPPLPAAAIRPHPAISPQHGHQPPTPGARPLIPLTSAAAAITPPNVSAAHLNGEAGGGPLGGPVTPGPAGKAEERKNEKHRICKFAVVQKDVIAGSQSSKPDGQVRSRLPRYVEEVDGGAGASATGTKEKKSGLLKLLAGASTKKKSRSPPSVSPTHDPQAAIEGVLQGAVGPELSSLPSHGRAGSCPIESEMQGAMGLEPLHRKTGSLDLNFSIPSPARQPLSSMAAIRPEPKPLPRERYRVVVPYPPQSEAEIELKEGDIVFVHKKREDGWYKGTLQRNGRTGLFPGSFVESF
ncbi:PREDICTED: SH3 domain-containing RING finger protein 3 [Nipponia nippon]|uniref:SH3 domain-containing RING finger protein 3 n=1 Tax=Nipponia nippon TaxID=128390 RepID=UPI000510F0A3|nr:PREDICTED: SH3 domain-containing RING finger protein 3 [Nipponia nippon]